MLPKSSPLLLLAIAVGLLTVHACIMVGGALGEAAVGFCAFALLIGAPIAVLAWFGSLSDLGEKNRQRHRELKRQRSEARLWQRTLLDLQTSSWSDHHQLAASGPSSSAQVHLNKVASAPLRRGPAKRRVLALFVTVASALGFMGCEAVPPANWAMVRPGMGTPELVALVGAPEQIKSDGTAAVWQYCRDFFGRNANYYMAVMVEGQTVREVQPFPVWSDAGCQDFYRTGF